MKRCFDEVDADSSEIGFLPKVGDINLEDSGVDEATLKSLLSVDRELWKEDVKGVREFYNKFGDKLPEEMDAQLKALEKRLSE